MITTSEELKKIVQEKYSEIALQNEDGASCCGSGGCGTPEAYSLMNEDYSQIEGYNAEADLSLGCGLPTLFAKIQQGDTVIDLGSGAGNDCFVARHETGETGKVIGIDFTEAMINKARTNAEKLGYNNVEFRQGDIENMPVSDHIADVIVSNCVLNLVPDKAKVIADIYRVLKPGGHFSISDIVLVGELPEKLKQDAEMYAGCVAGAIQKEVYLNHIKASGFENMIIQKEKPIVIPDTILDNYLSDSEKENFKNGANGIFSITVFAQKPGIKLRKEANETHKTQSDCCGSNAKSSCC
ncbi:MAG: arsenite methyltransferase [Lutibacter sp.]|nr:arsenite methyltransferase [Lutibacter sp.]